MVLVVLKDQPLLNSISLKSTVPVLLSTEPCDWQVLFEAYMDVHNRKTCFVHMTVCLLDYSHPTVSALGLTSVKWADDVFTEQYVQA